MQFTLYIPDLFGPESRFSESFIPTLPSLELMLGRARRYRVSPVSFHRYVATLMGCPVAPDEDVPVAAITRLVDTGGPRGGIWMRADPVHLATDRRGLVLIDAGRVELDQRDALALAADIKPLLESFGLALEVPHPLRWYVRLPAAAGIRTCELERAIGRDVRPALPSGPRAGEWLRLLNEIQICMHNSEVNRQRESRRLPPVNSVWFWGGGIEPQPPDCSGLVIRGDDEFLSGLALLGGMNCAALPAGAAEILDCVAGARAVLAVHDGCSRAVRYQDLQAWHDAVTVLERDWFVPLLEALRARAVSRVEILTDGLRASLAPRTLNARWRRARPFSEFIAAGLRA